MNKEEMRKVFNPMNILLMCPKRHSILDWNHPCDTCGWKGMDKEYPSKVKKEIYQHPNMFGVTRENDLEIHV